MFAQVWPVIAQAAAGGWSAEELELFVVPACSGKDPAGSMGDDAQMAVFRNLQKHPTPLAYFLYELFAQVTNPAWDSVKERVIGSLRTYLGARRSPFDSVGEVPRTLVLESPILSELQLDWVHQNAVVKKLRITMGLEGTRADALNQLCADAEKAILEGGAQVLLLTDRDLGPQRKMIPAVQSVSYLNRYLANRGLATKVRLIVETTEVRTPHDLAALLAYGASAVHPWAAFELIRHVHHYTPSLLGGDVLTILNKYILALETGLLKIMAKYGVADIESYIGSRNMESFGIDGSYAARYLCERPDDSPIGGLNEADFDVIYDTFHAKAAAMLEGVTCAADIQLPNYGRFQMRRDGVARGFDYQLVDALQKARHSREWNDWQEFRRLANERPYPIVPKDFFEPCPATIKTRVLRRIHWATEVCPIEELMDRMRTSPMSFGSISPEAHEDLALAAFLRGFRTNCGEGGEWPARMKTILRSQGKQVASGRFGVNAPYLIDADLLEIKICQGAKPGEGGALSGSKVTPVIGVTRGTPAHVSLTSPPPHHDIYSIEDLKQLIYDLKAINPDAQIIVKLVAARGIGTVAIGVTKAGADIIQIAGFNGGTGNAPLNSIHFAGYPWEIGLAEAHQALLQAGIRDEVLLGVDGGFLTGRDVVVAACLGAQMFGLGTAALISAGCVMNKMCHTNNCPVGVATNRGDLRKNYTGRAEFVFNYFTFIGEEVRHYLGEFGAANLDEIVGRTDLLQITTRFECNVDLSKLLYRPLPKWRAKRLPNVLAHRNQLNPIRTRLGGQICSRVSAVLETTALNDSGLEPLSFDVSTCNLATGARVSGQVARLRGSNALPEDAVTIGFHGAAGQSFGAWLYGLTFRLTGEGQDGIGKGMMHSKIVIVPAPDAKFDTRGASIIGNACAYGAGRQSKFYAMGSAGQRLGVLNKGAEIVVEGAGMHFFEYACGGVGVSLLPVGRNAFPGMTGGLAFVYDKDPGFADNKANTSTVTVRRLTEADEEMLATLKAAITRHHKETGSPLAAELLLNWDAEYCHFWIAIPKAEDGKQATLQLEAAAEYHQLLAQVDDVSVFWDARRRQMIENARGLAVLVGKQLPTFDA